VAVVGAMGLLFDKLADVKEQELEKVTRRLEPLRTRQAEFKSTYDKLNAAQRNLNQLTTWMEDRDYWADVLAELSHVFTRTEQITF